MSKTFHVELIRICRIMPVKAQRACHTSVNLAKYVKKTFSWIFSYYRYYHQNQNIV